MKNVVMKLFATFVVALAVPFLGNAEGLNRLGEPDYGGNWWNPSLNGMGVKVNVQNGVLDADWFAYNTRGDPIFLNFAGPLKKNAQGQDFYSGSLNIIRGSPPNTYQTHALLLNPAGPGSVTLTFADLQHATMIYRYTDPVDGSTQAGTLELTPYQYGCNLPAMWDGAFCVIPMGVKAMGVNQLPQGCNSWKDQCWRDAIKNGTVKL
ncbi:MAG TPA: hypothetical protein VFK72_07620, partial [Nevskia sp.]|nr:hypothetical protein [Nevskia sp.]